ncbi:MAG: SpoIID/LytB domain-containing protein [Acidimicrobiales bacterium]
MIRLPLRRFALAVLITLVAFGAAPVAADTPVPTISFMGGGFGHGIGMSQYGALGRAEAGHTYDEILGFYYPGTTRQPIPGPLGDDNDIDVRLGVRSTVAITPAGGDLAFAMTGGEVFATSPGPVTATYLPPSGPETPGKWRLLVGSGAEQVDLCAASACTGQLGITTTGTHVLVTEGPGGAGIGVPRGGPSSGAYARGRILLRPGATGGNCGSATDFCVVHGDLAIDDYLRGIAEIPQSWPIEAQKAQAVAARSYAASAVIRRNGNGNAWDVVNDTGDQYYVGYGVELSGCLEWCKGIDATANEILTHGGVIAETYYSASNGGATAEPPHVWASGSTRPYLVAKADPFDGNDANPYRAREVAYPLADVSRWLNEYHLRVPDAGDQLQVGTVRAITIEDVPASGRLNFAEVTIVGTKKTVVVTNSDGRPYGERFYNALKLGCQATLLCDPLVSSNFSLLRLISFTDVEFDDYFYVPVLWMTTEELTTGVTPTTFGSGESNTRGQLATFVWRFAGKPQATVPHGFTDLVADSYYEDAVAWMRENGITTGTSPMEFTPQGSVTRAQAATFLWRFAGAPESTADHDFTDVPDDRYFTEAVRWMVEWDITTGTTPTTFAPEEPLTRAQIATFLWRLAGAPGAFAEGVELPAAMRTTS